MAKDQQERTELGLLATPLARGGLLTAERTGTVARKEIRTVHGESVIEGRLGSLEIKLLAFLCGRVHDRARGGLRDLADQVVADQREPYREGPETALGVVAFTINDAARFAYGTRANGKRAREILIALRRLLSTPVSLSGYDAVSRSVDPHAVSLTPLISALSIKLDCSPPIPRQGTADRNENGRPIWTETGGVEISLGEPEGPADPEIDVDCALDDDVPAHVAILKATRDDGSMGHDLMVLSVGSPYQRILDKPHRSIRKTTRVELSPWLTAQLLAERPNATRLPLGPLRELNGTALSVWIYLESQAAVCRHGGFRQVLLDPLWASLGINGRRSEQLRTLRRALGRIADADRRYQALEIAEISAGRYQLQARRSADGTERQSDAAILPLRVVKAADPTGHRPPRLTRPQIAELDAIKASFGELLAAAERERDRNAPQFSGKSDAALRRYAQQVIDQRIETRRSQFLSGG